MKIIDFERKGNVVRFWLGKDDCNDFWGDDWDDAPYDCNAERVYSDFIVDHKDVAFPFDDLVLEPCIGDDNCPYSKEDMKNRIVPCIIVVPEELASNSWRTAFGYWSGTDGVKRIYLGDDVSVLSN